MFLIGCCNPGNSINQQEIFTFGLTLICKGVRHEVQGAGIKMETVMDQPA
jgi:hypothetical protein